ncbi:hypothetical protein N7507_009675 [Penicillium longicatenatum]|nr:hypothetical protein N7507_009675 [Penicillium longicatenatum]
METGLIALGVGNLLPSHDVTVPLATSYFSTWERLYRVIHVPSFWKQYHDICVGIRQPSLSFKILTLAILVLGERAMVQASMEDLESTRARLELFSRWTDCIENYCFLLVENKRLDLTAMQTLCLFTLYKATTCDRNEALKWTQKLVKCAVQTDLHKDPSKLNPGISPFEIEIRRRLWATILEIDIQVSLEHENSPPWTINMDHDVQEPSNLDDVELHPHLTLVPSGISVTKRSDCSILIVLRRCQKLRITFSNENEEKMKDPVLFNRLMRLLLTKLDSMFTSPNISSLDPESELLLRLHVLRASLKVMQGLTFRAVKFTQLQNTLTTYYKNALKYLQLYLELSPSTRNGSLLSSTLFEALSPVVYTQSDGFQLLSKF